MVICHEKKCIFIHIPKTAGTSIEQFLKEKGKNNIEYIGVRNNRSLQHLTAFELKRELGPIFTNYYKFSIIRNPYNRLLSEYYWTPLNIGYKAGETKADFITHVANIVKNKLYFNNIYNDHFIPQYLFLYGNGKNILVDNVFKYEDLDESIKYLKHKINIDNDLPFLNKSKGDIVKTYWNNRQKERIYKIYQKDFIVFNYEK
jgi:hypothetical protein